MKSFFISVLCIMAFTSCSNDTARNANYISENVSFYDPKIILDYVKKNKITPDQAISSIDALQKSFKNSYIGYNLKKSLINKSGDEIFNECKAQLSQNSEGLSSFEFYDYVLQCLAGFKDSHIYLSKTITPSFVSTGVSESKIINNKLYISRIRPALIKKIEELQKLPDGSLTEKLKVGTEILLIEGNSPQIEIEKLRKYISASSDLAFQNDATLYLFTRTFAYPIRTNISLTLRLNDSSTAEVVLPWVQVSNGSYQGSIESRTLLSDRGIIKSSEMNPDNKFVSSKGADLSLPLFKNINNLHTYQDSNENDALLTGVISLQNKNYCYMQLNTFDIDSDAEFDYKIFELINEKKTPMSLPEVLKNYLQSCEASKTPFIFDLRNNPGGNMRLAELIYAMFETDGKKTIYSARSNLSAIGNFSVIGNSLNYIDSEDASLENLLNFQSMKEALDSNSPTTSWILTKKLKLQRGLFNGDVFVLTSPDCVSACEGTANRFKKSGRAKIIGDSTNGTGFGFWSYDKGKTIFRDPLNLFEVEVPNHAFQTAIVENDSEFKIMDEVKGALMSFDKMSVLENNPVTPDIEIKYSLNDLMGDYPDYIESLSKVLEQSPPAH